jgi:hypothetical protein
MRKAKILDCLHKFRSSACKTREGDGYFSSFAKTLMILSRVCLSLNMKQNKYICCRLDTPTVKKIIFI